MKKMKLYGLAGVAALAAIGGTFAYYSATTVYDNEFDTINYGTSSYERFNPADGHEWKPGAKVDKAVYATNTGEGDVWVRIMLKEDWTRDGEAIHGQITSASDKFLPVDDKTGYQIDEEDGISDKDEGSVVYKELVNSDKWIKGTDGYYYYHVALKTGETTEELLKSVTLCEDTDMGKFDWGYSYIVVDKLEDGDEVPVYPEPYGDVQWIPFTNTDSEPVKLPVSAPDKKDFTDAEGVFDKQAYDAAMDAYNQTYKGKDIFTYVEKKLDKDLQGYANAGYALDIEVQFIQADEDGKIAKEANWQGDIVDQLVTKQ